MSDLPEKTSVHYTLVPLIKDGRNCLACRDVKEMDSAILESVEFYYGGSPWQRVTRQSDDVFSLVEQRIFKWPALERIAAARFAIRLKGGQRDRRITIRPSVLPNENRDGTNPMIQDWLKRRKFLEMASNAAKSVE
jgi:hypothetical protein